MIFFSFERNSSSVPLSCGFTFGFIPSPPNKIARFQRSSRQNLAISLHKNQLKSYAKMLLCSIFNGGLKILAELKILFFSLLCDLCALCGEILFQVYAQLNPCLDSGTERILFPVTSKIALHTADRIGGSAGSPRPVGGFGVVRKWT